MSSRWTGFFIWALVAVCTAFWALKIFAATHPVPTNAREPSKPVAVAGPMVRLFGATAVPEETEAAPSPASDRFQLVGVIAPRAGGTAREGIAIVSVDNQPAKAWHVGGVLEGDTTLLAVAKRSAEFGPRGGPSSFTLQLPEPAPPETGTLPPPVSQATPQAPPQPAPVSPQARTNPSQRPNMPYLGRPGLPVNPNMRLGGVPGQGPIVPPGRTPPAPGQLQMQQQPPTQPNEPAEE
jgi:general secretion pathway protein C